MRPTEQADTSLKTATRPRWSEVLRVLREARGVTQEGWAAQLSVSRKTVLRWEAGERVPDPGAEAAILAYCRERNLFRIYDRGPLAGLCVTAEMLQDLLAEARWRVGGRPAGVAPPIDPAVVGPPDATPDGASRSAPSNLLVQLTSFVGREREIATVRRLQADTRLLTLTGPGGVGKTRLALQVVDDLLWAYPHGVWLVELAALADPALVPQTVAVALGLQPTGLRSPTEQITDFLRGRHLLLVLDNCEHLPAACAHLVETLLHASPALEVITTSRESLGVAGGTVWLVPPMALPAVAGQPAVGGRQSEDESTQDSGLRTQDSDAVRLFVERARLHRPEFALTARNAAAVAEVCRRLDGIPLAIELAAARVKVLSPDQLAARLGDRFQLLTGGGRTALPRHQTLRATMDWSYDLLTAPEQALLRRLSVFAGGFTLEAAESLGNREQAAGVAGTLPSSLFPLPFEDVLDVLGRLVDKSLVIAEPADGVVRYRLLETVRQYAAEKLGESDETVSTRDRHLAWYLALAEAAGALAQGPDESAWLCRLEEENDNLRAALAWALAGVPGRSPVRRGLGKGDHPPGRTHDGAGRGRTEPALSRAKGSPIPEGQAELSLRLAVALSRFWWLRGHISEGRRWLEQALEAGEDAPAELRATALQGAGALAYLQADYAAARTFHEGSLILNQEAGNKSGIAEAQRNLGMIAFRQSEYAAARVFQEAGLASYAELGHKPGIAAAQLGLGLLALRQGDHVRAQLCLQASLALHRELGDKYGIADTLDELATLAGEQGDPERQVALLEESLALFREIGSKGGIALVLGDLGMTAWTQGDAGRALALLEESLTWYRARGESQAIARVLGNQAFVALSQRDYTRAETLCCESLTLYRKNGDAWGIGRYLPVLAGAAFGQGQAERAARLFGAGAALRERLGTPLVPAVRRGHDRAVAAVRTTLGDAAFEAAWSYGWAMPAEAAVADALADAEPVAGPSPDTLTLSS